MKIAAQSASSGIWHVWTAGAAACDSRTALLAETQTGVGRVPARPRCKRAACHRHWIRGLSDRTRAQEDKARASARRDWNLSRLTRADSRRDRWEQQGWLESHFVYVLHLPRLEVYRIGITRQLSRAIKPNDHLVDVVRVPNRLAATLIRLEVLEMIEPWRKELPKHRLEDGGASVWRHSGPSVDLHSLLLDLL